MNLINLNLEFLVDAFAYFVFITLFIVADCRVANESSRMKQPVQLNL